MRNLMRDKVSLIKDDGSRFDNIKANVQPDKILINDVSLPIEEGDKLIRTLPNNLVERYIVLDRCYYAGIGGIPPHYQVKVRKESAKELIGGEFQMSPRGDKPKVWVVYGHDRDSLLKLELTLRQIGADPLILSQLPAIGSTTIIEILEENILRADAIVVLLTSDDEGRERGSDTELEPRARQNTLIEAGYAVISQRKRSILISLGGVKIPSDFDGIYRVEDVQWSEKVALDVARRLKDMGLNVEPAKAI